MLVAVFPKKNVEKQQKVRESGERERERESWSTNVGAANSM